VQIGGRAAVGGRIGRRRRRDSAEGLQGRAAGDGAARSRHAGEVSRGRAGLTGVDQCDVARSGGTCEAVTTLVVGLNDARGCIDYVAILF